MGKQWKQWQTLFSWAPKSLQMVTTAMKLKDTCSLEGKLWPVLPGLPWKWVVALLGLGGSRRGAPCGKTSIRCFSPRTRTYRSSCGCWWRASLRVASTMKLYHRWWKPRWNKGRCWTVGEDLWVRQNSSQATGDKVGTRSCAYSQDETCHWQLHNHHGCWPLTPSKIYSWIH